ncbi:MAG: hypothetical protein H7288_20725 [Kineosporiaceae bacterium]|nr:hypothetical protein [Aeromicrobium sp.]
MHKNTKLRLGAVASLAVAAIAFGALPAQADPTTPPFPTLAGVGSDTTQDVVGGLTTLAPTVVGSWNAVGSDPTITTITTKNGGLAFKRPNGSGDGVYALSMSAGAGTGIYNNVNILGQLDYARSSSPPVGSNSDLTYIPFATDAVSYAFNGASAFPTDVPLGDTTSDGTVAFTLRNIYNCRVTSFSDAGGNDVTIAPLLPQAGSGTRSYWEKQTGLDDTKLPTCVTDRNGSVEEHNGTALTGTGDIMPYSIAQYIAQGRHSAIITSTVVERRGNAVLGKVGSVSPFLMSGTTLTLNPSFPIKRPVYNVVQTSRLAEPAIASTFVGSMSTVCSAAGQTIIKSYGFAVASNCGVTSIVGSYRLAK